MCYNWINRKREYLFYVIFQSPNQNLTWRKASSHGNYNTFTTIFVAYNWLKILYSQALSQRPHHFSSDIIFYLNLQFSLRLRSLSLRYMFNGFIYESAATLSLVLVGWLKQLFRSSQHFFKIFPCFHHKLHLCWLFWCNDMFQPSLFANSVVHNCLCFIFSQQKLIFAVKTPRNQGKCWLIFFYKPHQPTSFFPPIISALRGAFRLLWNPGHRTKPAAAAVDYLPTIARCHM